MSSEATLSPALRTVTVRRRGERVESDLIVVEEPLEIQVGGKPLVATMRTPGNDEVLAAGFLHAEGMIAGGAGIALLRAVAGDRTAAGGGGSARIRVTSFAGDRVEVTLAGGAAPASAAAEPEREFRATAACGVCGKASMDDLDQDLPPIAPVECRPAPMNERDGGNPLSLEDSCALKYLGARRRMDPWPLEKGESPQIAVDRGGASSMPSQHRSSIEMSAP